jgi:hypothetical protein
MKIDLKKFTQYILILSIASTLLSGCGTETSHDEDHKKVDTEIAADKPAIEHTEHTDVLYACPMHPEITGKKGDKCSKCKMLLTVVEDEGEGEDDHDSSDHDEAHDDSQQ